MKGSVALPARPSDDAGLLRFLATDYRWMVRDGILPDTPGNWRAFDQGYRASDARLTPPVRESHGHREENDRARLHAPGLTPSQHVQAFGVPDVPGPCGAGVPGAGDAGVPGAWAVFLRRAKLFKRLISST